MRSICLGVVFLFLLFAPSSFAVAAKDAKPSCDKIIKACKKAGFSMKESNGTSVNADCLRPIMMGADVPNATIPLPDLDPDLVLACRAEKSRSDDADGSQDPSARPTPPDQAIAPRETPVAASGSGPNIVFVLTDDLSSDLLAYMPNVQAMQHDGTSFENYFLTNSVCCPSRASILTGQFPHNHGVLTNWLPNGGYETFNARGNQDRTFAVAMQNAGYRTALIGKYLNRYEPALHGPAKGWDEWVAGGRTAYESFEYTLNHNGRLLYYGTSDSDYVTDVLAGFAKDFITNSAGSAFFVEISTFAPHTPYTPARRDDALFPEVKAPRTPAFNAVPDDQAPRWLAGRRPLTPAQVEEIDADYRKRAQSIQAVDRMIGELRETLASLGLADNTYLIFSSDNGYHMGEFTMGAGKMTPFDFDTHVPLVVVGPGVPKGGLRSEFVANIDLAPTFVALAGGASLAQVDGESLVPLLTGKPSDAWRQAISIEHVRRDGPVDPEDAESPLPNAFDPITYQAIRSATALYVEYENGDISYYDLSIDPGQMRNVARSMSASDLQPWQAAVAAVRNCRGSAECRAALLQDPGVAGATTGVETPR